MDSTSINDAALEALSQCEFYKAQILMRENARINPSGITLNNLGVFYASEGIFNSSGFYCRANKLGVKYLKKALDHGSPYLSFLALGHTYFKQGDFDTAICNFKIAYKSNPDIATIYNLAMSFYRAKEYEDALLCFSKALHICNRYEYLEVYTGYLFTLLEVDRNKCRKEISTLSQHDSREVYSDSFILSYLCGDLKLAKLQIRRMLKHWRLDPTVVAMVFECLTSFGKANEARNFLNDVIENYEDMDYNVKPEILKLKKISSQNAYRLKIISSFQWIRPLAPQHCYYGNEKYYGSRPANSNLQYFVEE